MSGRDSVTDRLTAKLLKIGGGPGGGGSSAERGGLLSHAVSSTPRWAGAATASGSPPPETPPPIPSAPRPPHTPPAPAPAPPPRPRSARVGELHPHRLLDPRVSAPNEGDPVEDLAAAPSDVVVSGDPVRQAPVWPQPGGEEAVERPAVRALGGSPQLGAAED